MTALEALVAALRERHPPTPELEKRLGPCRGRAAPMSLDRYYLQRAAAIAGAWLDELTDEELELRAAYDRTAHEEFQEYEDEDTGEMHRRRVVAAEQLRWTQAEVLRRAAKPKALPAPEPAPVLIPAERFSATIPVERRDAAYYQHHQRMGRRRRRR